ncbi:hypothetical protein SCP_1800550 [Sparassis crispa]|uniref:Uncharacterized protein n=1 Tax=Sparassis crispa TaxID=139825 RepID=A0A401H6M5_9APHY|nr:hypothetical protein SCP_1800550 [Sparassis crispa]GBE90033.1 hypothetical protein SCP_1800550 [Sparassis crispa]
MRQLTENVQPPQSVSHTDAHLSTPPNLEPSNNHTTRSHGPTRTHTPVPQDPGWIDLRLPAPPHLHLPILPSHLPGRSCTFASKNPRPQMVMIIQVKFGGSTICNHVGTATYTRVYGS